ncbi:MAG: hypothetical protein E1N59_1874 [Puniceicoccaceae bacterium 5H]|nr:MAG: hypothetical protein E1N59_1874 [Puniceicoccaceae bacterium 5H]
MAKRLVFAAIALMGTVKLLTAAPLYTAPRTDSAQVSDIALPSTQITLRPEASAPAGWTQATFRGPWTGYISSTMLKDDASTARAGARVTLQPNSQLDPVATLLEDDTVEVVNRGQWWTEVRVHKPITVYLRDTDVEPVTADDAPAEEEGNGWLRIPFFGKKDNPPAQPAASTAPTPTPPESTPPGTANPQPANTPPRPAEPNAPASTDTRSNAANTAPASNVSGPANAREQESRMQVRPVQDDFFIMPGSASAAPKADLPTESEPPAEPAPARVQVQEVAAPEPQPEANAENTASAPTPAPTESTAPEPTFVAYEPEPTPAPQPSPPRPKSPYPKPAPKAPVDRNQPDQVRELQPRIIGSPSPQSGPVARMQKVRVAPTLSDPYPVVQEDAPIPSAAGQIPHTYTGQLIRTQRAWYALHAPKFGYALVDGSGDRIAYVDVSRVFIQSPINEYVDAPVQIYGQWDTEEGAGRVIRARNMRLMAP